MTDHLTQQLLLVGTNHKHAPVDVRERLLCRADDLPTRFTAIHNLGDVEEIVRALIDMPRELKE